MPKESTSSPIRIHFIAIGGSIMHNLALALNRDSAFVVTGSDDVIFEPSKSRLENAGLLPDFGWHPDRITSDIDIVLLGMHAKADNPELMRARELGLKILSFPEFVALRSKDKKRVVIAGSHGKTTTTSMVMHALKNLSVDFDYLVGAQLPNFDLMVQLSDAPVIIIEGDEYLSSAIDRRPKFAHYNPHITVITGVAWDHMNVFPTKELYEEQFKNYLVSLSSDSIAYLYDGDPVLHRIAENNSLNCKSAFYSEFPHRNTAGGAVAKGADNVEYPLKIFGKHNIENLRAACLICQNLGVSEAEFLTAMANFTGAAMRMQTILENDRSLVLRDFAHAPSKVRATVAAVREKYPDAKLTAILELHTYSSLNKDFLPEYRGSLAKADRALVYYDPSTLEIKRLPAVSPAFIEQCFDSNITVVTDKAEIERVILAFPEGVHLWMSSGHFGGLSIKSLYD